MADTLKSQVIASIKWRLEDDAGPIDDDILQFFSSEIQDGTGVSECDRRYYSERSIAAGGNDDLDLAALTNNFFSGTLTTVFAKVKAILIVNRSATAGDDLVLRANVANSFMGIFDGISTARIVCGAGGPTMMSQMIGGWPVVNGSTNILRVNNPGLNVISYGIAILGTSV